MVLGCPDTHLPGGVLAEVPEIIQCVLLDMPGLNKKAAQDEAVDGQDSDQFNFHLWLQQEAERGAIFVSLLCARNSWGRHPV